jgi:hypothetical protein
VPKMLRKSLPKYLTENEQIVWLANLANLKSLKKSELTYFQKSARDFLGIDFIAAAPAGSVIVQSQKLENKRDILEVAEVLFLHDRIRALFEYLLQSKTGRPQGPPRFSINSVELWPGFSRFYKPYGFYLRILSDKAVDSVLLKACLLALKPEMINNLMRCEYCSKIFYRTNKRLYCSPRCARNITMRNWRTKTSNRVKESKYRKPLLSSARKGKSKPKTKTKKRRMKSEKSE